MGARCGCAQCGDRRPRARGVRVRRRKERRATCACEVVTTTVDPHPPPPGEAWPHTTHHVPGPLIDRHAALPMCLAPSTPSISLVHSPLSSPCPWTSCLRAPWPPWVCSLQPASGVPPPRAHWPAASSQTCRRLAKGPCVALRGAFLTCVCAGHAAGRQRVRSAPAAAAAPAGPPCT